MTQRSESQTMGGAFPQTRLRRNRQQEWIRSLVAEHTLSSKDFIWPLFLREANEASGVTTFLGVRRLTLEELEDAVGKAQEVGMGAVALFPIIPPEKKTSEGREAYNPENIVCRAIRTLKKNFPSVGVIGDVALDAFTDHGHDGVLSLEGDVDNDETLPLLCAQALVQAQAGVDYIAPSDMMDGRIGAIRRHLDAHGFQKVGLISYAAKFASAFYGPFRDILKSRDCLGQGHKKTYQLNPANTNEALREAAQDIAEGADILMIKPGLPYLDVIARIKQHFLMPTFAYHVSGEYAMLKFAAQAGALEYERAVMEVMLSFKRAGADGIFTYHALEVAEWLARG